jgi:hypothetical protein
MPVSNRKSDEWNKSDITGLLGVARDEGRFDNIRSMNAAGWQARSVAAIDGTDSLARRLGAPT